MVVGVAGKYCAGKSTVTGILADAGYGVIDVDRLGHEALARRAADVRATFGEDYLLADGSVDRKKLGALVFRDRAALRTLEGIVHPEMVQMVRERLEARSEDSGRGGDSGRSAVGAGVSQPAGGEGANPDVVVNAALLFPMGLDSLCDLVLWVKAPLLTRLRRARRRDGLPVPDILRRFWTQRELEPQPSASRVDIYSVENRGGLDRLRAQLADLSLL
jgi:dephospho-CoA kinase